MLKPSSHFPELQGVADKLGSAESRECCRTEYREYAVEAVEILRPAVEKMLGAAELRLDVEASEARECLLMRS